MREVPREAVDEDRGAAVGDGKRVAPEPEREPEPEVRGEQRVRALAREDTASRRGTPITIASSGSSSSARRSSTARSSASACATDGGPPNAAATVQLGPQRTQHVAAQHLGQRAVDVAQRRARDPLERLGVVRIAAQRARELADG